MDAGAEFLVAPCLVPEVEALTFTLTPSPPPSTSPEPGTCGYWADGTSAIMITYDGKVIGNEVMPTLGMVKMLGEQPIRLLVPERP